MSVVEKTMSLDAEMRAIGERARAAASLMALADPTRKTDALKRAAATIRADKTGILDANKRDLADAGDLSGSMRDRLMLDDKRIESIARGLEEVAALPDPVGAEIGRWTRPNGLDIARVRIPLGVVGIIYEFAAQRDGRRRRPVLACRQCRYPARRLGKLPFFARHRGEPAARHP